MKKIKFKDSIGYKLVMPIVLGTIVVTTLAIGILYFIEKANLEENIQINAQSLVHNLHNASLASIAKGQRKTFQDVIDNFTKIDGVKEAYLYNSGGFITYLSGYDTVGKPFVKNKDGSIYNPNEEVFKATNGSYTRDDWSYNDMHKSNISKSHREQNMGKCASCHITIDTKDYKKFQLDGTISKSIEPLIGNKNCITCHTNWTNNYNAGYIGITVDNSIIISQMKNTISRFFIALVLVGIISIFIALIVVKKSLKPLEIFQDGLYKFFRFLNNEIQDTNLININSIDEIGLMAQEVNKNITKTKDLIHQDRAVIDAVKSAVNIAKTGKIDQHISISTQNEALNELKNSFNELFTVVSLKVCSDLNRIQQALESFQDLDFTHRINGQNLGEVSKGLNALADIITQMLIQNKYNGEVLEKNASTLLQNVQVVSKSSNHAASSLEETAAALEEMTGNISSTTNNIIQMSDLGNNVKISVNSGQKLANQTTSAMDEINTQVASINDAIYVIDQIAFQTNILSLNAAVEAATAGEAGKGFAVVAQEVRNLANRSSEAAKEIKSLVEAATEKANNGKDIADQMIEGYNELNNSISQTLELISDVEMSSKEQLQGIEQINNAVATLDSQTQQNAQIANDTAKIAQDTQGLSKEILEDIQKKKFIL